MYKFKKKIIWLLLLKIFQVFNTLNDKRMYTYTDVSKVMADVMITVHDVISVELTNGYLV